ncbi:hypothetical protein L3V83_10495 [Thiotrichales bacterium 19X7-9]|nr:hypothetical protein [Thiotrichales bacterium 19X7-9]
MTMTIEQVIPVPLFDTKKYIFSNTNDNQLNIKNENDYLYAKLFLQNNARFEGTFNSYRREVERLLHWCWLVAKKSLPLLTIEDINKYLEFCQSPPQSWRSERKLSKFINSEDHTRIPNPNWRPFLGINGGILSSSKETAPSSRSFNIAKNSLKEMIMILSTFFNYLLKVNYASHNPIILLRQKICSKIETVTTKIKFTKEQLADTLFIANYMSEKNISLHERSYFIVNLIINMRIKPSELVIKGSFTPTMADIIQKNNKWYLRTNKKREVEFDENSLIALIRWRRYLALSPLPVDDESDIPLVSKLKGYGAIESSVHIRRIIQDIFDVAANYYAKKRENQKAEFFKTAKPKWLRYD